MARANFVKAARKKNPVANPGESYWWWQLYRGRKQFSKERPRPSQLTGSAKKSQLYAAQENLEDFELDYQDASGLSGAISEAGSEVEGLADEWEESQQGQEEAFPGSENAERMGELADGHRELAQELEEVAGEVDSHVDEMPEEPDPEPEEQEDISKEQYEADHAEWEAEQEDYESRKAAWDSELDDLKQRALDAFGNHELEW